jgi:glutaredoxin
MPVKINVLYIALAIAVIAVFLFGYNTVANIGGKGNGGGNQNNTGNVTNSTNPALDSFARCLTAKGVVMYGSATCPHCSNQKALFGSSFQYINYVECTEQYQLCNDKGIRGVPTWEINGTHYEGERTFKMLAQLSGCAWTA